MQPGIYSDLSNEQYHGGEGISKSGLWKLHTKSPAHYRAEVMEETDAMKFGTAAHMALLEPEKLERFYARLPDAYDGRTKAGKDLLAAIEASGVVALKAAEFDAVLAIRDKLHAEPLIKKALAGAQFEYSAYWIDDVTGELCRCRPDAYNPGLRLMVDLKTTVDASPSAFPKSVANFGYHMQQAWYRDGWEAAGGGEVDAFVFIAVEKTAPFAYAIYDLNPTDEAIGRMLCREALDKYAACKRADDWPAYPTGVQSLSLPAWARPAMPEALI